MLLRVIYYGIRIIRKLYNYLINFLVLKINKVIYGDYFKINGRIYISNHGKIQIGTHFITNSGKNLNPIGGDTISRFIVRKNAMLVIGDHVGLSNTTIVCWSQITIGNYVYIGGSCKIWDTDFHSIDPIERRHYGDNNVKTAPITIGDYVFIGGGSIILKGVSIGKNSIIAAGSVVTKSIPDNEIWGGNPAKKIKSVFVE